MFLQILKESLEMGLKDALTETIMEPVRKIRFEIQEDIRKNKEIKKKGVKM